MPESSQDHQQPWYREGLRFECTQCGACCSGEPGYVWVQRAEIRAMAFELGLDAVTFSRKFVRQVGPDHSLIEYPDGDCIMLDRHTRRCKVYRSRPTQCRTWPFWDSTVNRPRDWQRTCDVCPGAGQGRLYTLEEIDTARQQRSV